MKTIGNLVLPLIATLLWALPTYAQSETKDVSIEGITERLEQLEQQNSRLLQQISTLRRELDELKRPSSPERSNVETPVEQQIEALEEKAETQAGLLAEQSQVNVQSSQRLPIRITGMALFNAFKNTAHGQNGLQYPRMAQVARNPSEAGASLRQTSIGLEFQSPYAVLGGAFKGKVLFDLFPGYDPQALSTNAQGRLRLGYIEGQWKTRSVIVGQDKPIFNPREPDSLAQVGFAPLSASGNLYLWLPQMSFEQRLTLGARQDIRADIGVVQIAEDVTRVPAQFVSAIEKKRPALEGRVQFGHHIDDQRRVEIATGFHTSSSHVLGTAIPSRVVSVDWFWNPLRRIEFTGAWFTGKNLAAFGGAALRQSFTFLTLAPGQVSVIPVRSRGGWAQITLVATSRLSFNLQSGVDDPNNHDLPSSGIARNSTYVANTFYRLAPNVVTGLEVSRVRTLYMAGQHPITNHYDLYLAYMF
jgi:hypothetical protein